jgi:hypothetical protein
LADLLIELGSLRQYKADKERPWWKRQRLIPLGVWFAVDYRRASLFAQ